MNGPGPRRLARGALSGDLEEWQKWNTRYEGD